MLHVPVPNEWGIRLDTHPGRITSTKGVSVTPAQNSKGSYFQIISGASLTFDVYAIEVVILANNVSAAIRDAVVDIGTDVAGGTTYTVVIPDLIGSDAGTLAGETIVPYRYYFPLGIKAGSSIGARAAVNNATVGTLRVFCILYGKPNRPEQVRVGSVVQALTVNLAGSRGTTVVPGTTSEGSWTSLGTLTRDAWWWRLGLGIADATITGVSYASDLSAGAAGGDKMILEEVITHAYGTEQVTTIHPYGQGVREIAAGETIHGRIQCATNADSTVSMIAYALS
jgi:hypothetical protein